jgi:RNA polymerase sigma factor (sigma-70 family)
LVGGRVTDKEWEMEAQLTSGPRAPRRPLPLRLASSGDERLARLVAAGSERAFAVIYERYHQQLYRYCHSIAHSDADAQDALQSTFAGALAALQRGQRNAPLRPWLFRIAHNETISLLRRQRPTAELSESEPAAGSTEERAAVRARLAQLVADLQELPARQRGALVMRELSGLSHEEIAIALTTTSGAAKQAIFDARQALAEFSEGRAMACEEVRRAISDGDRRVLRARRVRAHLRGCDGCAAFAAAIPARSSELRVLAPPLAPLAAAGVLAHLTQAGVAHGGGAGLGAAASAGAGKTIGATLAAKALVGVVVVTAATVGVSSVLPHADRSRTGGTQTASQRTAGSAGSGSARAGSRAAAQRSAVARARRTDAHHGAGGAGAPGASAFGGVGSALAPASTGLSRGLRAHGAPSARGHSKHPQRKRSSRPLERGSHGKGSSSEHRGTSAGGRTTGAPGSSHKTTAGPQATTPTVSTPLATPLAPGSARTSPSQGPELTTRK